MQTANTIKRVKLSPVVNYNGFADAFYNLPSRHSLVIRREFQKRLGWSRASFYLKCSGESPIRQNEVPVIQEIFTRFGLNPWTGEKI